MDWITVILLLLAGITLLVVEIIFIPGTTVIGIIGTSLMVFGVIIAYGKFGNTTGTIILAASILTGGAVTYLSFKSGMWRKFALNNINTSKFNEDIEIEHLLGAEGITLSVLKPYGKAEIFSKTYEVKTLGDYLAAGSKIKVISIDKNHKIIVEQIKL